jgi:hypothetical protein
MPNQNIRSILMVAAICLVIGASFAISSRASRRWQQPAPQQPSSDDARALREAYKREGLRGVAKLKGSYVAESVPSGDRLTFDLEHLTKGSAAVIVGRFKKKLDARLIDNRAIFTDYEVAVEELVKGDLQQANIIVTVPGGRVVFEDGTSAELTTPTFEHPRIGSAYALFLTEEAAVPSVFFLSGGSQGIFDLEASAGVKSHGRPDDPGAVEAKGKSREAFMNDVREHAKKWPKPGKCCG